MSVFISYRREDSQSAAGRLAKDLVSHGIVVFRDVGSIRHGADFVEAIEGAISASDVMLLLIGPRWLSSRLNEPHDYHRQEIVAGLSLKKLVIPVLVDGGKMPQAQDLPQALQSLGLGRRNAFELSDKRWDHDVAELAKSVGPLPEVRNAEILLIRAMSEIKDEDVLSLTGAR